MPFWAYQSDLRPVLASITRESFIHRPKGSIDSARRGPTSSGSHDSACPANLAHESWIAWTRRTRSALDRRGPAVVHIADSACAAGIARVTPSAIPSRELDRRGPAVVHRRRGLPHKHHPRHAIRDPLAGARSPRPPPGATTTSFARCRPAPQGELRELPASRRPLRPTATKLGWTTREGVHLRT